MDQLLLPGFSRLRVQPRNLLPAGMEITPYNHHAKAPFFPASLVLKSRLPVRIESSLLSNQLKPGFGLSGFSSTHLRRAANPGSPAGPVLARWGGSSIPSVAESATPATRRISPCTAAQSTLSPSPTSTSCTPAFPAPASTDPPPAAGLPRANVPDVPPAPPPAPPPRPPSPPPPTPAPT